MKVKQFLNKFWNGTGTIQLVELYREKQLLVTLDDDDLSESRYGGYQMDKIDYFMIAGTTLKIFLSY